jgi:hypothetical protein
MKTVIRNILICAVLLVSAEQAFAYPPDNAAVLYYKAFMLMKEPNDAEKKMLRQFCDGNIVSSEQIRLCLESNQKAIKEIVTAAQIKNCDWGLDYSEGFAALMPHLAKCREVAYILAADAKISVEKSDYKSALDRYITIHNLGIHVGNDMLISCLVSRAIGRIANRNIVEILPQMSGNYEMLERLRARLGDVFSRFPTMKGAMEGEAKCNVNINKKDMLEAIHSSDFAKGDQDKVEQVLRQQDNNDFYVRLKEYSQRIISRLGINFDLPYPQARQAFDDIYKEVETAAKEKPEAAITQIMLPAINRVLTTDTRDKTYFNAVLAGIDIYLTRAKTGKLPDELPAGLPKDLFSGKDFLYEKTNNGFVLKCQGKDEDKNVFQQYEFKVGK